MKMDNRQSPANGATGMAELAFRCAKHGHLHEFEMRRVVFAFSDVKAVCYVNNNPYASFPDLRDQEVTTFRAWLAESGFRELAFATYPPAGDVGAGYTFAMLIEANEDDLRSQITPKLNEITLESAAATTLVTDPIRRSGFGPESN